jgi:carbon storage regulator CsrA
MLVLSRKEGERLVIGEGIVITVVRIDGNRVRIGVQAPPEIRIQREELLDSPFSGMYSLKADGLRPLVAC